jgi:group I intron endonuclease
MIVYLAKNTVNGKCYVGCTSLPLAKRRQQHCGWKRKENLTFQNAIKKYGTIAFEWEVIEVCSSKEHMMEREKFWIKEFSTVVPNGYNMTFGGEGGKVCSEAIEQMRVKKLGKKASEETKIKMSKSRVGKKMSAEFCEAVRKRVTGSKHSEKTRKKIGDLQRGQKREPRSEETKRKISVAHKGMFKPIPSFCIDRIGELC